MTRSRPDSSRPGSSRPGSQPYAGPRLIRFLAGAVLVVGLGVAVFGVAYAINGATRVGAQVAVPVELAPEDLEVSTDPVRLDRPAVPEGAWLEVGREAVTMRSWDSTLAEQLLARGDAVVLGLSLGLGGFLLRRVLLSTAEGRPFEAGNPRRLAVIAVLIAAGGTVAGVLPDVAGMLVLDRLGLTGPDSPFVLGVNIPLAPVLVAPFVLALAEAFRRGAELAADVDGLV